MPKASTVSCTSQPSGRREDVLTVLRSAAGAMTIADVAEQLEVHPNTVRFHLEALTADGRVERIEGEHKRQGRPPQMFRTVSGMDPGGARRYRLLAEILTSALADDPDASAKALGAGRAWAGQVARPAHSKQGVRASINRLVKLLDDLGFAPQQREVGGHIRIGLRHCPFLELAESARGVVCPIHLGLMQGAMTMWSAPATVDRLEPFTEPDLCLAHIAVSKEAS